MGGYFPSVAALSSMMAAAILRRDWSYHDEANRAETSLFRGLGTFIARFRPETTSAPYADVHHQQCRCPFHASVVLQAGRARCRPKVCARGWVGRQAARPAAQEAPGHEIAVGGVGYYVRKRRCG